MPDALKTLLFLAVLGALVISGSTSQANPDTPRPESAPETNALFSPESAFSLDEDSDPAAVQIEELRAELAAQVNELRAMQRDAESARPEDARALASRSIKLQFEATVALSDWVDNVKILAANGEDVSKYRAQLEKLLPDAMSSAQKLFAAVEQAMLDTSTKLKGAADAEASDLQSGLDYLDAQAARILAAVAGQIEGLDYFELPSEGAKTWLSERLGKRARLAAARIHLASLKLTEAESTSNLAPEDTALSAEVAILTARLGVHNEDLTATVEMMGSLEMDTTLYQRVLIESTGELTTDMVASGAVTDLMERWLESVKVSALENGPSAIFNVLIFALVVVLFWSISRVVKYVTTRGLDHSGLRLSTLLKRMIVSLASGGVLTAGILIAFSQLGFEIAPLLAGLGIAGFVLGFALQETLANFAAGIMILTYRPYDVHDLIECSGGVFGRVSSMNLVSTTILTLDNQTRVVPNGKIWGDVITNVTAQHSRRVDLVFGTSYSDDIPKTEEVLKEIVAEHPKILDDPEPLVKVHELGDSSVNFVVRPWVERNDYWDVYWDITREVKLRFDREGISIPFPQHDVHLPGTSPPPEAEREAVFGKTSPDAQDPLESED